MHKWIVDVYFIFLSLSFFFLLVAAFCVVLLLSVAFSISRPFAQTKWSWIIVRVVFCVYFPHCIAFFAHKSTIVLMIDAFFRLFLSVMLRCDVALQEVVNSFIFLIFFSSLKNCPSPFYTTHFSFIWDVRILFFQRVFCVVFISRLNTSCCWIICQLQSRWDAIARRRRMIAQFCNLCKFSSHTSRDS